MSRITQELLRKRAEHNEGRLTNLEEVTLHQQNIIKIETLDQVCRHLRIIYLQNNIIDKIENLSRLKELEYLNLALNNITVLENLEHCESLRKLDLTINFIDVDDYPESLRKLSRCQNLRELYLTGNPVTDYKSYRDITIALVPQLNMLDGKEISKSERITAIQLLPELLEDIESYTEIVRIKRNQKEKERLAMDEDDPSRTGQHHPEERKRAYWEQQQQKDEEEKRKNPEKYKEKAPLSSQYRADDPTTLRQCNEGRYAYQLSEFDDPKFSFFAIEAPKYLDTSQLTVDLYPDFVSVRIKDKLTQVRLQDEIIVSTCEIQRSTITGKISIKMPKLRPNYMVQRQNQNKEEEKKKEQEQQKREQQQKMKELDQIEKNIRNKDTSTFTGPQFQEDDEMPDLE